jgi:DNA-binding transcriptional LysR family regulator
MAPIIGNNYAVDQCVLRKLTLRKPQRRASFSCQTGAMELHHLRCFVAVAEERHFGRAAQRLHLSTAPISRAVRALEDELGVTLFVRSHHDVRLTAAGSALRERAANVLRNADSFADYARSLRETNRTITLGGFHLSPPTMLDRAASVLRDLAKSNVEVQLVEPADMPRRLAAGTLDFALLNPTLDCVDLPHRPVAIIDYMLVMRADDALAARDRIDWSDLAEREVTLPPDLPFASPLNDLHAFMVRHGVRRFDRIDSLDVAAMASRVRTHGSVIPTLSLEAGGPWRVFDDPAFAVRPFREPPPPFVLSLGWHPRAPKRTGIAPNDVIAKIDVRPHRGRNIQICG